MDETVPRPVPVVIDSHHCQVTPARINAAGETLSSAMFHCLDCRTGFVKSAVRGDYSSPQPCPAMEQCWNGLRPKWRRVADKVSDRYYLLRHVVKKALWRLSHG